MLIRVNILLAVAMATEMRFLCLRPKKFCFDSFLLCFQEVFADRLRKMISLRKVEIQFVFCFVFREI